MEAIILIGIYVLSFGVVTSIAAAKKGRGQVAWFWIGVFLGVFGLIAALVIEPLQSQVKRCPDCAEEIKAEARVCRFCGHKFTNEDLTA